MYARVHRVDFQQDPKIDGRRDWATPIGTPTQGRRGRRRSNLFTVSLVRLVDGWCVVMVTTIFHSACYFSVFTRKVYELKSNHLFTVGIIER